MQMCHTCLWMSETHENGQKCGGSDGKAQKLWNILWGARAEGRAVFMQPEEQKHDSEKETNRPFIFRTPIFPKNRCDFCLYSLRVQNEPFLEEKRIHSMLY